MKKQFTLLALMLLILTSAKAQKVDITKENICKKWELQKYELFWVDYDPEEHEKNDYIFLKPDNTYESIDEGKFGTGTWSFSKKGKQYCILLKGSEGSVNMIIDELRKESMVLIIDNKDLLDLEIHFKAN